VELNTNPTTSRRRVNAGERLVGTHGWLAGLILNWWGDAQKFSMRWKAVLKCDAGLYDTTPDPIIMPGLRNPKDTWANHRNTGLTVRGIHCRSNFFADTSQKCFPQFIRRLGMNSSKRFISHIYLTLTNFSAAQYLW
jgi:hypothetical protein